MNLKPVTPEKFAAQAGKGRPKGVPNKVTREVREMLREALDKAGGAQYLLEQAHENPQSFLMLVGKLIPAEINQKLTGTLTLEQLVGMAGKQPDEQ